MKPNVLSLYSQFILQKMFTTNRKSENGFSIVTLTDEKNGCYAEITPECGATLHAFGLKNQSDNIQVIDHYQSQQEFDSQVETLGYKGCKLSPFVCRLKDSQYTFGEETYTIQNTRGVKHALHGLIYKKPFEVIEEDADHQHALVRMKYSYKGEDAGYPFDYECIVSYTLSDNCKLTVQTECINKSQGLLPIQDGWHPYFDLGEKVDQIELEFQSLEKYEFNDELVPTGKTFPYAEFSSIQPIGDIHFDNSFSLDSQECQPLCVLRNKERGIEIQILPRESYPILQIYTPPHRNSIAIENLSGPPNAFNLGKGFITLEAGQNATFETSYRINFI